MRPNVKTYQSVKALAKKYGATAQFELNVSDSIEGDKCVSKYLRLTPEVLDIVLCDDDTPMYVGKEAPNFGGQARNMEVNGCGAGYNSFCVTPDGELIPCCAFHMSFGNLREKSVNEIVRNSEQLNWWQQQTLKHYEECGRHPYCDYCNLCPGNNFSQHGTPLKAAENNCYMAKCRYDLAQRLKNGETPLNGKTLEQCLEEVHIDALSTASLRREF
jgi:radical SAM superfamily protein, putative coenzyme PQQ synthesis protein E